MEDVTTWAGVLATLNSLALTVAIAVVALLAWSVRAILPMLLTMLRTYLQERITAYAKSRLDSTIQSRAAAIVDPANAASSVVAEARDIATGAAQAMANSGSTVEGVAKALQSAVSQIRLGLAPSASVPAPEQPRPMQEVPGQPGVVYFGSQTAPGGEKR